MFPWLSTYCLTLWPAHLSHSEKHAECLLLSCQFKTSSLKGSSVLQSRNPSMFFWKYLSFSEVTPECCLFFISSSSMSCPVIHPIRHTCSQSLLPVIQPIQHPCSQSLLSVIQPILHICFQSLISLLQFCKERPWLNHYPCFMKPLRIRFWLPQPISFSHFLSHSTFYPSLTKPSAVPWTAKSHPNLGLHPFLPSLPHLPASFLPFCSFMAKFPY